MVTEKISDTYHVIHFDNGNVIHLVGTAHVSNQSVEEVRSIIEEQHPDRVCIELDDGRMKSKTQEKSWENMDIKKILKDGKGFLLLANTALASFQKRMGAQTGADPGPLESVATTFTPSETTTPGTPMPSQLTRPQTVLPTSGPIELSSEPWEPSRI